MKPIPPSTADSGSLEVLDTARLLQTLAEHDDPLAPLRSALQQGHAELSARFEQGVPAAVLVPARARLVDQLLVIAWKRFFSNGALSLIAVGGYGRGELHPCSDIDIMILGDEATIREQGETIGSFLTLLWDIGLEVGHSVRTIRDCRRESATDVTVMTTLMEARPITGEPALFEAMRQAIDPSRIWPEQAFFEAKKNEQKSRYRKYHETAYNLEPNVKEGPGGLRDLQTIAWVSKRHFGATTLQQLIEHDFLTEAEYHTLIECQNFLWQVRFALHELTGRREDRLLFDYQRQLATQFGYHDQNGNLAVEQFMQRYYRTIMATSRLNEMLLQLFEEAILLVDDPGEPVTINRRFQARRGFLEVRHDRIFERHPFALLELFLLLQQRPELKGVRAATVRLIRDHCHLINARFRTDSRARSLFMEILRQPRGITRALRRMNRYGVLSAYLPEFAHIVGRMQYDLYHVYTVDQHTLFVVRNLRRFYVPEFSDEFPHCSELIRQLPKPELLYIAGLFHDIAKGRNGDHSELGARDAELFCRRHDLSEYDTRLVAWLVRHHLLMSLTAQKKDIQDPDVILDFARQVHDKLHLDYLYLLTIADIRGTNPKLWNSWRAALLRELYEATRRALRRGLDNPIDKDERIQEIQAVACVQLQRKGIDPQRILKVWHGFSEDYFLRYSASEIVWHTRAILKKADDDRALVLARRDPARGGTELFIYMRDSGGIFATTTATLDRLGLTVLDARIITSRSGYTLDSFTVMENTGEAITERARCKEIVAALRKQLNQRDAPIRASSRQPARALRHFPTPTEINFIQDNANHRTLLELTTGDRPGLLCRIGRAFTECAIQLHNAKIATIGARAEDLFHITDAAGHPLEDPEQQQALRDVLLRHLEKPD